MRFRLNCSSRCKEKLRNDGKQIFERIISRRLKFQISAVTVSRRVIPSSSFIAREYTCAVKRNSQKNANPSLQPYPIFSFFSHPGRFPAGYLRDDESLLVIRRSMTDAPIRDRHCASPTMCLFYGESPRNLVARC